MQREKQVTLVLFFWLHMVLGETCKWFVPLGLTELNFKSWDGFCNGRYTFCGLSPSYLPRWKHRLETLHIVKRELGGGCRYWMFLERWYHRGLREPGRGTMVTKHTFPNLCSPIGCYYVHWNGLTRLASLEVTRVCVCTYVKWLFNYTVWTADLHGVKWDWNMMMNSEWVMVLKEIFMACLTVLPRN
jgi:hypothetical protein